MRNPAYAGAYVFGRRRTRQIVDPDGSVRSSVTKLPPGEWEVLIPGHHEGYISWEQYLANQAKLAANRTNAGARPPREGTALCQGIMFCGSCGRAMGTRYNSGHAYYECSHSRADHVSTPGCRSVRADTVDAAVTDALLDAVAPGQLALALAAAEEVTTRRQRSIRAAELAVERARYQAQRAERAYHSCEPENRLVARSLETRWETSLTELASAEAGLATQQQAQAPLPAPGQLQAAAADMRQLWHAPTTAPKDRKRLLRTLIGDITLRHGDDPADLRIGVRWNSGATTELAARRPRPVYELHRTSPQAIDLARRIGPALDNNTLAQALNDAGHRTGAGRTFDATAASNLRTYHRIAFPSLLTEGDATPSQVARLTGAPISTIHYWISTGYLPARRGPAGRWAIPFPPEVEQACRDRLASSPHHPATDARPRSTGELSVTETAAQLGVSPDVIYTWTAHGHIPARRGPAGRIWISLTPDIQTAALTRIASSPKLPARTKNQAAQRLERKAV